MGAGVESVKAWRWQSIAEVERLQWAADAAQEYEQRTVPTIAQPITHVLFDHVPLRAGDRVSVRDRETAYSRRIPSEAAK
jgi:hypothetical protein